MTEPISSSRKSLWSPLAAWHAADWLALVATVVGLILRVEHAITFDGPARGGDYAVNLQGVRWMTHHWRPFFFSPDVSYQVGYQPPLWHAVGAVILLITGQERPIAWVAVIGWVVRQALLLRIVREAIPEHPWSRLAALAINAFLPMSVLTDGKLNPEGLHTTLFMVAIYGLWRIEREAQTGAGAPRSAAIVYGSFSGLALLTKATAGVLPLIGAIVFGWQAWCMRTLVDRREYHQRLLKTALIAGASWCIVAGWWCGTNLIRYHHPFPHIWNLRVHLRVPLWKRRPLDWFLPFTWRDYLRFPIYYMPDEPRANFWSASITGMWTDFHNRGFCRLVGGGTTARVFGANWGPAYGPEWHMSWRCIHFFARLLRVGLVITVISVWAVCFNVWQNLRSAGKRGSLVLPGAICVVTFFVMMFAVVYPFDNAVVLNPRYLMPGATPMAACLGLALASVELPPRWKIALHAVCLLAIFTVGAMVVYERIGA